MPCRYCHFTQSAVKQNAPQALFRTGQSYRIAFHPLDTPRYRFVSSVWPVERAFVRSFVLVFGHERGRNDVAARQPTGQIHVSAPLRTEGAILGIRFLLANRASHQISPISGRVGRRSRFRCISNSPMVDQPTRLVSMPAFLNEARSDCSSWRRLALDIGAKSTTT